MVRQTLVKNVIKGEMADIWNLFTQEEKAEMLAHFEVRTLKKDSTIYKEGEESKFLIALYNPNIPSWIISSLSVPLPKNLFATLLTSPVFLAII